jgi:hypothetical protein
MIRDVEAIYAMCCMILEPIYQLMLGIAGCHH